MRKFALCFHSNKKLSEQRQGIVTNIRGDDDSGAVGVTSLLRGDGGVPIVRSQPSVNLGKLLRGSQNIFSF